MNQRKHLFDAMQESRIAANAKTNAERQREFRARKAAERKRLEAQGKKRRVLFATDYEFVQIQWLLGKLDKP